MIVDANVLISAVVRESPHHEAARSWLVNALNGDERVGFPWVSLLAFQRIMTHPRIARNPLTAAEAWSFVTDWLAAEMAWVPEPGPRHHEVLGRLLLHGDLRGNLVTKVHLAALAVEYGTTICSFDSDFARIPEVRWLNPLHV